jgi:hypothetical protein
MDNQERTIAQEWHDAWREGENIDLTREFPSMAQDVELGEMEYGYVFQDGSLLIATAGRDGMEYAWRSSC